MRSTLLLATLAATAGCALPSRDNPIDPSKAPSVTIRMLENGIAVSEAVRSTALAIDVTVRDPQNGVTEVTISLVDPETTERCPDRFETISQGPYAVTGTSLVVSFEQFPAPCFEGDPGERRMRVDVRAEAVDKTGARGSAKTEVTFRNAVPVADPGPTRWVDPTWFIGAPSTTLSASRSVDADGVFDGDFAVEEYTWRQIAGPPLTNDFSLAQETLALDLGNNLGAVFTLELEMCDAWEDCSEPVQVDVHVAAAAWMLASDGVALLDASWSEAQQFYEPATSTAPQNLPVASEIAPAQTSIWVVSQAASSFRMLRSDFVMDRVPFAANTIAAGGPGFGGPRPSLLGWEPSRALAWIRTYNTSSGLYSLTRLAGGSPPTATALTTFTSDEANVTTAIAQFGDTTPLWTMGLDFVGGSGFLITKTTDAGTERFPIFGGDSCFQDGYTVEFLAAASDGSVWAQSAAGTIHIAENGEILDCVTGPRDAFGNPSDIANGLLIVGGIGDLLLTYAGAGTLVVDSLGSITPGPQADVFRGGIHFDRPRGRIVVATDFSIEAFAGTSFASPVAELAVQESLSGLFQNLTFAVDHAGRPSAISTYYFGDALTTGSFRLPYSLSLFRARHRNDALRTVLTDDRLASIDHTVGTIWVARPASGGGWEAALFEERGAVVDTAGAVAIPLPGTPRDILFDPGDANRTPGMWVSTDIAGANVVARVKLDGTIEASAGNGSLDPFPTLVAQPKRMVIDPFDGTLWFTIDASGPLNDGAYHLFRDGSGLFTATTTQTDTSNEIDPSGLLDIQTGNYWFTTNFFSGSQRQNVTRVTLAGALNSVEITASCGASATGRGESLHYDPASDHVDVVCIDSGSLELSRIVRMNRASMTVTTAVAVPAQTGIGARHAMVSPVTGTIWAPHAAEMLFLDRFGNSVSNRALPMIVERPIRH